MAVLVALREGGQHLRDGVVDVDERASSTSSITAVLVARTFVSEARSKIVSRAHRQALRPHDGVAP